MLLSKKLSSLRILLFIFETLKYFEFLLIMKSISPQILLTPTISCKFAIRRSDIHNLVSLPFRDFLVYSCLSVESHFQLFQFILQFRWPYLSQERDNYIANRKTHQAFLYLLLFTSDANRLFKTPFKIGQTFFSGSVRGLGYTLNSRYFPSAVKFTGASYKQNRRV